MRSLDIHVWGCSMRSLRIALRFAVTLIMAGVLLLPSGASAAYVLDEYISGPVRYGVWYPYYTERTTNAYPYNISFGKSDGPGLSLRYRSCGASAWRNEVGPSVYFSDPDDGYPDDEHQRIRYGPNYGNYSLTFCLSAYSVGSDETDTFSGQLSYWRA